MKRTDSRESKGGGHLGVPEKQSRNARGHRSGVAMIWTAIVGMLLILIIGICVDTAKVALVAQQLQNAADAAALAGGRLVKFEDHPRMQTRALAMTIGQLNFADGDPVQLDQNAGNQPDGDIVVGRYNRRTRTFTPSTEAANALKVVARRTDQLHGPIPLNFGPIAGIDTANVSQYAIAMSAGGTGAGLIALKHSGTGLHMNGTVILDVNDGDIQVNSFDDDAVRIIGTPEFLANEINTCGYFDPTGGYQFPEDLITQDQDDGVDPIPDPLCPDPDGGICLPAPAWDPASDLSDPCAPTLKITEGTHVLQPGYYSGGFEITGGDVTLKPGIYILGGGPQGKGGLVVGGNTNFCAMGVMFYVTDNGKVDLAGTGNMRMTPIGAEGEACEFCDQSFTYGSNTDYQYTGVTIFQARDNHNDACIVGTNLMDLDGTLYFPENHLDLTGTGDGFGNALIADTIEISGTGRIVINYDGRYDAPGTSSFLVE
jgi:hypothetical protein